MLWFYKGVTVFSQGMPKTLSSYDDMQFIEDITVTSCKGQTLKDWIHWC
jgi:hypothetical protein